MPDNAAKKHRYGWQPDVPDHRDHLYAAPIVHLAKLPSKADLRAECPPVYDQGQLGSCTANAIGAAIQFERRKQKLKPDFTQELKVAFHVGLLSRKRERIEERVILC